MAARRPAKIASKKKGKAEAKTHPVTGKPLVIGKILSANGPSGMYWVPEGFDGSEESMKSVMPVR